jgi:hypothetical protein
LGPLGYEVQIMDDKPCCANEALRRINRIRIHGISTRIAMLEKIISEVKALRITDTSYLKKELMNRVKIYNYVPTGVFEAYADAVLQEYLNTPDEGEGIG